MGWKDQATKVSGSWKDKATKVDAPDDESFGARLERGYKNQRDTENEGNAALLNGLVKVANYPAGLIQTAASYGLLDDKLTQKGNQVTLEDLKNTLLGNAPSWDEYLARAGVKDDPVNLPFGPLVGPVSKRKLLSFGLGFFADPLTYFLGPEKNMVGDALENVGKTVYKSGVKNLDLEAAKYGKEPVSDVLRENKIWGSPQSMQKQMDALADQLLEQKRDILKQGTREGAEVDMNSAVKRAQDFINEMRRTSHPEQQGAIDALQARLDKYKATAAKDPEQILRTLPYSSEEKELVPRDELFGYKTNNTPLKHEDALQGRTDIPGQSTGIEYFTPNKEAVLPNKPIGTDSIPVNDTDAIRLSQERMNTIQAPVNNEAALDVINNPADEIIGLPQPMESVPVRKPKFATVLDETERQAGPTPLQVDKWKSSNNGVLPDNIWRQLSSSGQGYGFDKALNGGLSDSVQEAIEKTLGPEAGAQLAEKNDKLGRILTTQERAERDAAIAERKNFVTPVDTGLAMANPWVAAAKKAGDFLVRPSVRTGSGLLLEKAGQSRVPDTLSRRWFIDEYGGQ